MWQRISLRARIYLILAALVFITLAGGFVTVWYSYKMERLLTTITEKEIAAFQTAEALEIALANQKGFLSYYFIEGDADWLRKLGEYRQIFKERLYDALSLAGSEDEEKVLKQIKTEYARYIDIKDRVIGLYQKGDREEGVRLHRQARDIFFSVLELCQEFKDIHEHKIIKAKSDSQAEAGKLRIIVAAAVLIGVLLAVLLAFVLGHQILSPVRRLTAEAEGTGSPGKAENEVSALSRSVRGLLLNVDRAQSELQKSRESLLQAEKLALVGKLAAGMAHSIRNPFTSVKMRLFSLSRSLEFTNTQKEDFDVIAEEIRRIDTIVQNFLEFSRPPKLIMQSISPSVVVDQAIQLLEHRLKSYDVSVSIERLQSLPEIDADPEQLKEVLVNLVVNACEAMERGGSIVIREEEVPNPSNGRMAVIRVSDNGPGIADSIRDKVLQPFFTTKEEGTGLGLSIAARIVAEHGGQIDIESNRDGGATFIVVLPIKEASHEHDSDY
ncbi:MAG: MCP four helix bundle domain-containing protein [Desulfobacterales bacterium]|nr:MAG: MCP four helix bundle domain-containing protein [Desulfobacterales bacterium]